MTGNQGRNICMGIGAVANILVMLAVIVITDNAVAALALGVVAFFITYPIVRLGFFLDVELLEVLKQQNKVEPD